MSNVLPKTLDYDDIVLQPSYSLIESRDNISTKVNFLEREFYSPVLPANMACTIDFNLANKLANNNYFYILHRFYDYYSIRTWLRNNQDSNLLSISVGVKDRDYTFINNLSEEKLKLHFITVDVSHGHNVLVKNIVEHIKNKLPKTKIIAGNITTKKACEDYIKWGVHAAKVGLSRGKACTTFNNTGIGSFMFSAVKECASTGLPIIADGGVRQIKDISIALVGGANMVMVGSLFAACNDSPADLIKPYTGLETEFKVYFGSASAKNKGHSKYIEGQDEVWLTPNGLTYFQFHDKIEQGVRSTMSFGGFKELSQLKKMKYLYK